MEWLGLDQWYIYGPVFFSPALLKMVENWLRYGQKPFCMCILLWIYLSYNYLTTVCIIPWSPKIIFLGMTWLTCPKKDIFVCPHNCANGSRWWHSALTLIMSSLSNDLLLCTYGGLVLWIESTRDLAQCSIGLVSKSCTISEHIVQ